MDGTRTGSTARVCLGVVVAAHGVRGRVRVKTFTEVPELVAAYGPLSDEEGARRFDLIVTSLTKGGVIAEIAGVDDRDAAAALKGTRLYVDREVLPEPGENEYYHMDLVGLRAERSDGTMLGEVIGVHDFGAGHVIEVELEEGRTVMVPFTKAVVPEVELAMGRLVVDPPPGLIEERKR